MDIAIVFLQLLVLAAIAYAWWFVKNLFEQYAKQHGELDAKLERLPDLTKIQSAIKEGEAVVEVKFKGIVEDVLQRYRVRLAVVQNLVAKKLDAYNLVLDKTFDLYRQIAKIGEAKDIIEFEKAQDEYYVLFHKNGLYLNAGVRRAAEMFVAILNDVGKLIAAGDKIGKETHNIRERARLVADLIRVEMAIDLNQDEFTVFQPTREQRDKWIAESNKTDDLKNELESKSGATIRIHI